MFGIQSIRYKYAPNQIDLVPLALSLNRDTDFLSKRIGTSKSYFYNSETEIFSDCHQLFFQSCLDLNIDTSSVSLLLFVGQVRLSTFIPPFSSKLHSLFGLSENCLCIDVGHGCSGYVVALDLAYKHFLATGSNAIIVTCDPYRSIISEDDVSTSLLFSDAVSLSFVGKSNKNYISNFRHFSDSSNNSAINYFSHNHFTMNGREVMSYVKDEVVRRIFDFSNEISVSPDNSGIFILPHHGSRSVVDLLSRSLRDFNVVWDSSFSGNTVSSSIPILLTNTLHTLPSSSTSVLCGFGVGLSTSLCRLHN